MFEFIAQLAIGVVIAVVSAVLATSLSALRYYRERWWERKYELYVDVLNALHDLEGAADELSELAKVWENPKNWEGLRKKMFARVYEIKRLFGISKLILSNDAVEALQQFVSKTEVDHEHIVDQAEELWAAAKEAYKRVLRAAERDLKKKTRKTRGLY